MSDAALGAWRAVASGDAAVPFMSTGTVKMADRWFPGPLSHPYPSVSNCHTDAALAGQPGVPIAGLPDCERPAGELADPGFELTGQDSGPEHRHAGVRRDPGARELLRARLHRP